MSLIFLIIIIVFWTIRLKGSGSSKPRSGTGLSNPGKRTGISNAGSSAGAPASGNRAGVSASGSKTGISNPGTMKNAAGGTGAKLPHTTTAAPTTRRELERQMQEDFPDDWEQQSAFDTSARQPGGFRSSTIFRDMEDRENDWLARQMREEQRARQRIMSDMLSLKREHEREHAEINGQ